MLSVAHVVRWALDTHRSLTLAFLVSLMIGALRLPVIEVLADTEGSDPTAIAGVLLAIVLGAVAVFVLDRHTEDLTY
ncbi:undecaprenyl phosphate translocase family protein [Natrialbaceae archaeon GCM10025896]